MTPLELIVMIFCVARHASSHARINRFNHSRCCKGQSMIKRHFPHGSSLERTFWTHLLMATVAYSWIIVNWHPDFRLFCLLHFCRCRPNDCTNGWLGWLVTEEGSTVGVERAAAPSDGASDRHGCREFLRAFSCRHSLRVSTGSYGISTWNRDFRVISVRFPCWKLVGNFAIWNFQLLFIS
jgi:hypothetical protein